MIWDKLSNLHNKISKVFSNFSKTYISVFLILFLIVITLATSDGNLEKQIETVGPQVKGESLMPSVKPSPIPDDIVSNDNNIGISGQVTEERIVPSPIPIQDQTVNPIPSNDSISSGNSGLISAVNIFRSSNGLDSLSSSGELCMIAEKRLKELTEKGSLDSHAGFNKYFQGQSEFNAMGEVIFQSSNQTSPEYAVNEGWVKSTSGHKENMIDPKWNYGCGATNGYFAVFNFGKK